MKRKRRRYNEHISPDNLIVGPWSLPIPKETKIMSIASAVIFAICMIAINVIEKASCVSSVNEGLTLILLLFAISSFVGMFAVPVEFLGNKLFGMIKNAEAREEMREREEREREEMLAEEAKWSD